MDSVLTSFRTSPYGRTACVQNTRRATRFTLVFCRPSVRINVHRPQQNLAEREGFEPSVRINVHTLSRRAP